MNNSILYRYETSNQGTFGKFISLNGFKCETIELPWRDNNSNISCIPVGQYQVEIRNSPRFGETYWVKDVQGRSWILGHQGNLAGDKLLGYKTHSNGCILVGKYRGILTVNNKPQLAVLNSLPTLNKLIKTFDKKPFILTIVEGY